MYIHVYTEVNHSKDLNITDIVIIMFLQLYCFLSSRFMTQSYPILLSIIIIILLLLIL